MLLLFELASTFAWAPPFVDSLTISFLVSESYFSILFARLDLSFVDLVPIKLKKNELWPLIFRLFFVRDKPLGLVSVLNLPKILNLLYYNIKYSINLLDQSCELKKSQKISASNTQIEIKTIFLLKYSIAKLVLIRKYFSLQLALSWPLLYFNIIFHCNNYKIFFLLLWSQFLNKCEPN